jgi:hypothetical protein
VKSVACCLEHCSTKIQEESNRRFRLIRDVTFDHIIFPSAVIVVGEGDNVLPLLVGRVVMSVDGSVNMKSAPMVSVPSGTDL